VARAINTFLLQHGLRLVDNPCISPDFCLDWGGLAARLKSGAAISPFPQSRFETAAGAWTLAEEPSTGDCAWLLAASATGNPATLPDHGIDLPQGGFAFPASWENLLRLKNLVQEQDPGTTIFPTAGANLGRGTLGVGARFTTLHWPAVEWAMAALGMGFTANQNSIPRELVYDTDVMLAGRLESVPFPFIGTGVPEGHQGQSVEGMSHGAVLSKLRTGFHRHRIEWSFNADHQPVGGRFDSREDALVRGCLLASYITFDLSPELAKRVPTPLGAIDPMLAARVRERITVVGCSVEGGEFERTLSSVWPAMQKAALRDAKYAAARSAAFTTTRGKAYLKELSIDELPGLTTQATTALVLALGEELGLNFDFIAPAFGFRKNLPFPDNEELRRRVALQWDVCRRFDVGIGFHSGSGKSAENYRVLGEVTGGCLEIKTSGRYTYEMGVALAASSDPSDRALWDDWYRFTLELAVNGAFSAQESEREVQGRKCSSRGPRAARLSNRFPNRRTTHFSSNTTSSSCWRPADGRTGKRSATMARKVTRSEPGSIASARNAGSGTRAAWPPTCCFWRAKPAWLQPTAASSRRKISRRSGRSTSSSEPSPRLRALRQNRRS
jgi:hypothetical protein